MLANALDDGGDDLGCEPRAATVERLHRRSLEHIRRLPSLFRGEEAKDRQQLKNGTKGKQRGVDAILMGHRPPR